MMIAKLIKTEFGYKLNGLNGIYIASEATGKLSIKNCQAIENGYDLEELALANFELDLNFQGDCINYYEREAFKFGFQKALENLGDKKFSEEDMIRFGEYCRSELNGLLKTKYLYNEYQSLQQTEWDVEICCLTDCQGETIGCKDASFGCKICTNTGIPKLDADGCLILKRVEL